jgi:hypothetical protein
MENSTIEIFFASGDFVQWAIIILLFKNSKIIFMSLKMKKYSDVANIYPTKVQKIMFK